jgi:RimJ/RimL family protein N-acetyltransferase
MLCLIQVQNTQAVGKVEERVAGVPDRTPIDGETVRLEPVDPGRHAEQLFKASAGADSIWDYLAYGPFESQALFTEWLGDRAASKDPIFYAVVDRAAGAARGMASYMRIEPEHRVIEIGHIWFAPMLQRTRQATEAIYLMSRHAFDDLGYRRLEWKCNALNAASMRAAERFGFTFEGIFRQHMIIKGQNRDTAWFSIVDGEWPLRRAAFEAWLSPANFDQFGAQRRSLSQIRSDLQAT